MKELEFTGRFSGVPGHGAEIHRRCWSSMNVVGVVGHVRLMVSAVGNEGHSIGLVLPKTLDFVPGIPGLKPSNESKNALDTRAAQDLLQRGPLRRRVEMGDMAWGMAAFSIYLKHVATALYKGVEYQRAFVFPKASFLQRTDMLFTMCQAVEPSGNARLCVDMFLGVAPEVRSVVCHLLKIQLPAFFGGLELPCPGLKNGEWAAEFHQFCARVREKGLEGDGRIWVLTTGLISLVHYVRAVSLDLIDIADSSPD